MMCLTFFLRKRDDSMKKMKMSYQNDKTFEQGVEDAERIEHSMVINNFVIRVGSQIKDS